MEKKEEEKVGFVLLRGRGREEGIKQTQLSQGNPSA